MTQKLRRKRKILLMVGAVCLFLLGAFLLGLQTELSVGVQQENTQEHMNKIQGVVDEAYTRAKQSRGTYDEVYQAKAATAAYMADKDKRFRFNDQYMRKLASQLEVTNLMVVSKSGRVLAKAEATQADFSLPRYNQLRTVFDTELPSEAFEVTIGEKTRRYYGAKIDGNRAVVVEQDPAELHQILEDINSWDSILGNVKVGLDGYAFAVSSQDYTFLYHPDQEVLGQDSLHAGVRVENLEDGWYGWMNIKGQQLYCGVKQLPDYNAYVVFAVPEAEMQASRNITVGVVLFIVFMVMVVVAVYGFLVIEEQDAREEEDEDWEQREKEHIQLGRYVYNAALGRKLAAICAVGLLFILVVSFYMQTLFALSLRSISNKRLIEDVQETFVQNEENVERLTEQYNNRYLNKCLVAADLLSANPQLQNKEDLAELSYHLGIEFIVLYDKYGRETVSDSSYVNFQISKNPEDQSYVFGKLLQGLPYVIQEPMADEISGQYHQYIGSLMFDTEGNTEGFIQIAVYPDKMEEALAATELPVVLSGIQGGSGGFAFAVDRETKQFSWYPEERLIGKDVFTYGMEERQLRDSYCDYITIENQKYYGTSMETDTDYIYVATPDKRMNQTRIPVALVTMAVSLLNLLIMYVILTFTKEQKVEVVGDGQEAAVSLDASMMDIRMPDGRIRRTESAASRWAGKAIRWREKTSEQRLGAVLEGLLSILALVICISVVFKDEFFGEDSIFLFIINGEWERGINIFAITGCIMILCVVHVLVMIVRQVLRTVSRTFGARGETICRMLRSFVKYLSFIAVLYYCFALLGVDTETLLASAGILSLVIGLGANTLVSDILAGLFIIFEGEFRVGDIVTIGDWRGTVQEIGVRTTKIMDPNQNVKIISNSQVSGVINMTRKFSFAFCDVGVEYGESLERVENILAKELPQMKKRIPGIKEGPYYKGVVSLGDNSVNIRILAVCKEEDRIQVSRDMNREMKLLFDRYDINIPFPQVVLNQPKEFMKATELEKKRAEDFNRTQKELSRKIREDEDGDGDGGDYR